MGDGVGVGVGAGNGVGDGVGVGVGVGLAPNGVGVGDDNGVGVGVGAKAKTVNWVVQAAGVPGVGAPTKFTCAVKLSKVNILAGKLGAVTNDTNSMVPLPE